MRYFVSSTDGNDSNSGTSKTTPFKTTAPINSLMAVFGLRGGDIVQFKSGDIFPGAYLTGVGAGIGGLEVSSYGNGNKPLFDMYKYILPAAWVNYSTNIWRVDLTDPSNYTGNQGVASSFNGANVGGFRVNGIFQGKKLTTMAKLVNSVTQWDYACTDTDSSAALANRKYLYVKSFGNPGYIYASTEIAISIEGTPCLNIYANVDYFDIDCLGHGGVTGSFGGGSSKVTFNNISVREYGGSTLANNADDPTIQYGTGIQSYGGATDCAVIGCYFEEGFETAMTLQSQAGGGSYTNITFRNNRVNRCPQAFEIWHQDPAGFFKNVKFQYNICENTGADMRHYTHVNTQPGGTQYFDQYLGVQILMYSNKANMKDVDISKNVFYMAKDGLYCWYLSSPYNTYDRLPDSHDNDIFLSEGIRLQTNTSTASNLGANQTVEQYANFVNTYGLEKNSRWYILPTDTSNSATLTQQSIASDGRLTAENYADNSGLRLALAKSYQALNSVNKLIDVKATDFTIVDNVKYPTTSAVANYVAAQKIGLWNDRGAYNPTTTSTYPTTGGSGVSGAVKKGDIWTISVVGTVGGIQVETGDTVRALVDTPGTTASNWAIMEHNLGYTPFNAANMVTAATPGKGVLRGATGEINMHQVVLTSISDNFDGAYYPGVYYIADGLTTTLTGQPYASFNGMVVFWGETNGTQAGSTGYQEAIKWDGSLIYRRMLWGGAWRAWHQITTV